MTVKKRSAYEALPDIRSVFPRSVAKLRELRSAIDEYVIDRRRAPFFHRSSRFYTQGSCFAEHLHNSLAAKGYASHWLKWVEDINSPLALATVFGSLAADDPELGHIRNSDVAVITVGVAPCWFRRSDDAFVLNNELNLREIDGFYQRTLTVEESKFYLLKALSAIKLANPRIQLVLTLSPVPLARTFEFHSAVVADAVSKSVLRAALHEIVQMQPDEMFYFPAYEIVSWLGRYRGDAFGADEGADSRHVTRRYVDEVLDAFIRHYQIAGA